MSQAKLAAAKELIQEKHYAEARILLKTVNSPTAIRWLEQLDSIAPEATFAETRINKPIPPPPPSSSPQYYTPLPPVAYEAERYYRAENRKRKRRRIGGGFELIFMGIACFVIGLYMSSLPKFTISGSPPPDNSLSSILLAGGVVLTLTGIFIIRRRSE